MLYSEFLEGTGSRDNDANYAAYRRVEALYMIDEAMTKDEAYRLAQIMGWVDNSMTEVERRELEQAKKSRARWANSIADLEGEYKQVQEDIKRLKSHANALKADIEYNKAVVENYDELIRDYESYEAQ